MIPLYKEIGEIILKEKRFDELSEYEKKLFIVKQFLYDMDKLSWKEKTDGQETTKYGRLTELNIDTSKKECKFVLGPELTSSNKDQLMIFENYAPGDPSIYASHISPKSIFQFELADFIKDLKDKNNFDKIGWTDVNKAEQFLDYIMDIQNTFYKKINNVNILRYDYIVDSQKEGFPDPELIPELNSSENIDSKSKFNKKYMKCLNDYLSSTLKDLVTKRKAFALRIDGKLLHQGEYADCYIDVLYYYLFGRHYSNKNNQGYCHICGNYAVLPKNVALNQKFYGTTNPLYFDSVDNRFTSNAFSMCETCNQKVLIGTQYSSTNLNTRLLGLDTIILPEIKFKFEESEELIDPNELKNLVRLLERKPIKVLKDIDFITKLERKILERKINEFNLLFYNKPSPTSQEFIINGFIRNINTKQLIQKTIDLAELAQQYKLEEMYGYVGELSLEGLRYLIIPSRESHPGQNDYTKINKNIINLIETYLNNHKFKYKKLIYQFVDIFNRKNNNLSSKDYRQNLDMSPYIMNLYLKHLIKFNQLEGVTIMEERKLISALEDKALNEYFNTHSEVYGNNYYAQGLFILGKYIAEVEAKQRQKNIQSTLINRLNLRGIPVQKVLSLVALVDDMRNVWGTYCDPITDNYYRECLQNISKSSLTPEEVVYHILCGRAYENYRRKLYFQEENNNTETNQEENND
ncbi:MAG: TM1802 family CRISPR-associated protein [Candidatus Cloacimonetes bacterium]|nr:TM1802 family CRISPR-associated protein [Candidatus Cloacimonadota bacterium]